MTPQQQHGAQHRNRHDAARLCHGGGPVHGEEVTEVEAQQRDLGSGKPRQPARRGGLFQGQAARPREHMERRQSQQEEQRTDEPVIPATLKDVERHAKRQRRTPLRQRLRSEPRGEVLPCDRLIGGDRQSAGEEIGACPGKEPNHVRRVRGVNEALLAPHHFVLHPRGSDREICTLRGAENLPNFEAAIEVLTGVRVPPRQAPREDMPPRGPGGGGGGGGDGEGPNHEALRLWVQQHPQRVVSGLRGVVAETEVALLSGDRVDVVYRTAREVITIEVKSRDSNCDDLQRGIYQCVKYRAVMAAQEEEGLGRPVRTLLVTETPLPVDLAQTAKRLDISLKVVSPGR